MSFRSLILTAAVSGLGATAHAGNEPGDVHLSAYAGQYTPQADVLSELGGALNAHIDPGTGLGVQATIWMNPHVGLAASYHRVETTLTGQISDVEGSIDTSVQAFGGRLVVGIGEARGRSVLNLSAGIVSYSIDYGDVIESSPHAAGVIGADVNLPLGEHAGLTLGVDDYVYDVWYEFDGVRSEEQRQHDVVLRGGITFFSGR